MPPPGLEDDLGAELKDAGIKRLGGFAENRSARICPIRLKRQSKVVIRHIETDVIERVECVGAELNQSILAGIEVAPECKVCSGLVRTTINIAA